MCNGLDGSKRKPLDRTKGRVGTRRLDDWAEYRNLWVGDDEQARMLTLIRWQNSVGSACSNERFRWLGKKRRGSQTGVAKAGLGSDASSRAMCCSKCLSWPKFIFWGSLIHTHAFGLCAPSWYKQSLRCKTVANWDWIFQNSQCFIGHRRSRLVLGHLIRRKWMPY